MERTPNLGLPLPYAGSVSLRTALRLGFERINDAFGLSLPTVASGYISPRTLIRRNFRALNTELGLSLPVNTAGVVLALQTVREAFQLVDDAYTPVLGYRIDPTHATVQVGGSQQMTLYEITGDGEVDITPGANWASSEPSIATVDSNGLVTAVAEGSATITAQGESAEVEVTNPVVGYRMAPTTLTLTEGETGQATIFAVHADNSEVDVSHGADWASSAPETATVADDGLITAEAPGTANITAEGQTCVVTVNPIE